MNVSEALRVLTELELDGYGGVEIIVTDCRSGDTGSFSISKELEMVSGHEDMGALCDREPGTYYAAAYMDH